MNPPTLQDLEAARARVYAHLRPTPLLRHPLLDEWLGCTAWVKHENHNPTGSFKIRGGLNLVAQLTADERRRGVVSASTGNHGQSMAFACHVQGRSAHADRPASTGLSGRLATRPVPCHIFVPLHNNPDKNAAMRALGATVVEYGRDFDEAREQVEALAPQKGWRYVHSANEPHLIAGVGTYALEIFDELPDADYVFVPVGGGSGAAGCCIARTGRRAHAKVIGVQAAGADAFARSWRGPARVDRDRVATFAEGMATRTTYDLTFSVLKAQLDDVMTLEEEELREGVRSALRLTHNLAEGAGAAALAAARQWAPQVAGRTIVCVMTGGNIDAGTLRRVLAG
ncbi:MAG: threonine/serine dehydratase [Acidobacteria bacterium]|nr:threonine/serine dehydratase [Acidobacteriota bacterium]